MIEDNSIRVRAFDFETRVPVGEFETCGKAANKLFIKSAESISDYVNLRKRTVNKSGVKSKKTGKVYHFEKIEK